VIDEGFLAGSEHGVLTKIQINASYSLLIYVTIINMKKQHGGKRPGAGRKAGSSPYGESTKVMRVPQSVASVVEDVLAAHKARCVAQRFQNDILHPALDSTPIHVPLFSHKVAAGFPSPADDYVQNRLSLDEHLIQHKEATFFVRAKGNSMVGAGIFDGDLLVVDRSLSPTSGDIVIAIVDGDLTVKRFTKRGGKITLRPENPRFKEMEFKDGQELEVWGVVTSAVKKFV
jgi:DNA polymerase V